MTMSGFKIASRWKILGTRSMKENTDIAEGKSNMPSEEFKLHYQRHKKILSWYVWDDEDVVWTT